MPRCARAWRARWPRCEAGEARVSTWLAEWWTYRPADFLMFSPRIYARLFESLNAAWWPAQPLLVGAGLAWLVLQWRAAAAASGSGGRDNAARGAALGLAACWTLTAWAFLLERYAPINWAATGFAAGFALQALGLALAAAAGGLGGRASGPRAAAGVAIGLWALVGHPLLPLAFGQPWRQAEVFGLAPDPTALATLAFLLLVRGDSRGARWRLPLLWVVPLAWCALSAATLATMGSAQAAVMLAVPMLALLAARRGRAANEGAAS